MRKTITLEKEDLDRMRNGESIIIGVGGEGIEILLDARLIHRKQMDGSGYNGNSPKGEIEGKILAALKASKKPMFSGDIPVENVSPGNVFYHLNKLLKKGLVFKHPKVVHPRTHLMASLYSIAKGAKNGKA